MTSPHTFVASFSKRVAAAGYDALATAFAFYVLVGTLWDATQRVEDTWSTYAAVVFVYHFAFLALREGRTLGKHAQAIYVLSAAGSPPSVVQAALRAGVRAIPLPLLDIGPPLSNAVLPLVLLYFIVDAWLVEKSPSRQSVADRVARTLVVNLPPLQPHRAPAVPMYSASDAEFGTPPKANPGGGKRDEP